MNNHTAYETQDNPSSYAWEEQAATLLKACEAMPGPEYGDCRAWDGLVAAMPVGRNDLTYREQAERLLDILRLMRAHGASCDHSSRERNRQSLLNWWGADAAAVASIPVAAPQCAACMCERKDVVSDRLVLGKPASVCCGEVA